MKKNAFHGVLLQAMTLPTMATTQDTHVDGYYNNSETYVQPHYRSAPNGSRYNNHSTQGNITPYTGASGTQTPNAHNAPQRFNNSYSGDGFFGTPRESMDGGVKPRRMY